MHVLVYLSSKVANILKTLAFTHFRSDLGMLTCRRIRHYRVFVRPHADNCEGERHGVADDCREHKRRYGHDGIARLVAKNCVIPGHFCGT